MRSSVQEYTLTISSQTLRKLNAVSVPRFVTVPKTEEEDAKLKSERESQQSV